MSRILIADDEMRYREELAQACGPQQHELRTAASGREAIDVGVRFRPEVLITDWLLGDHIHGIHVAQALHAVDSRVRAVLITAFASRDLHKEVVCAPITAFLEKPFDLASFQETLTAALAADAPAGGALPVGVLDVDPAGRILFASRQAGHMLATAGVAGAPTLEELFGSAMRAGLAAAEERWCVVSPHGVDFVPWWLRSRRWSDGGTLLAFCGAEHEPYTEHPIVRLLLGLTYTAKLDWPFAGNVLIVDRAEVVRRVFAAELAHVGRMCHAADSAAAALDLLRKDADIGLVVVDYHLSDARLADLVRNVAAIRPGAVVVGCGDKDHRADFARLGVTRYVSKPFVLEDFAELHTPAHADGAVAIGNGHPLVRKAVQHIERQLPHAELTVESVARSVGVNTTYLAHLFTKHAGVRMSRYIAVRRVELAKSLLATTDWQVKHVAFATGHRNANWFTEVFRQYTGKTPSQYRRTLRDN